MKPNKVSGIEQVGSWSHPHGPSRYRQFMKLRKRRLERRKAKLDPTAPATYKRYKGYD